MFPNVSVGVNVQAYKRTFAGGDASDGLLAVEKAEAENSFLEKMPLFVLGGVFAVITYISQHRTSVLHQQNSGQEYISAGALPQYNFLSL